MLTLIQTYIHTYIYRAMKSSTYHPVVVFPAQAALFICIFIYTYINTYIHTHIDPIFFNVENNDIINSIIMINSNIMDRTMMSSPYHRVVVVVVVPAQAGICMYIYILYVYICVYMYTYTWSIYICICLNIYTFIYTLARLRVMVTVVWRVHPVHHHHHHLHHLPLRPQVIFSYMYIYDKIKIGQMYLSTESNHNS
jgi:hypothetical protein